MERAERGVAVRALNSARFDFLLVLLGAGSMGWSVPQFAAGVCKVSAEVPGGQS